jgi:hypothetical protein
LKAFLKVSPTIRTNLIKKNKEVIMIKFTKYYLGKPSVTEIIETEEELKQEITEAVNDDEVVDYKYKMYWMNDLTRLMFGQNSKVAIIGSRSFNDYELLKQHLSSKAPLMSEIISGGARGTDSLAERFADEYSIKKVIFQAEWNEFGRAAGMIRNKDIIKRCDVLIAFWDGESRGTKYSIDLARKQNKIVHIVMVGI